MPGKELVASIEGIESPILGSLKAHKALPRRKLAQENGTAMRPKVHRQRSPPNDDIAKYITDGQIKPWIPQDPLVHDSESPPIRVVPVIGVPLTPPINFRDHFKSWIDDAALRKRDFTTQASDSSDATSLVQRSPPTPETTPPRQIRKVPSLTPLLSFRNVSDSRTDSFRTAHENFSSDGESRGLESPSLHPARQKWLRTTGLARQKDVGLGLGLESEEDEEPTPRKMTPVPAPKDDEFVNFEGAWEGEDQRRIEEELRQQRLSEDPKRRSLKRPHIITHDRQASSTASEDANPISATSLNLRQRVEQNRSNEDSLSTAKFAEQIDWPLKNDIDELDADIREVNDKRLSQASTNSTIVEAMVIDSPPRRRQTLRHTGKLIGSDSNRSSLASYAHSLRQRDRNVKSPDEGLRSSFAMDTPEEMRGKASPPRRETALGSHAPVIVIPDRRSSLQSSTSSSKHLSNTFSTTSRPQSSRPTTAPEENVGYFDIPRRDRRALSVVIQQVTPSVPQDRIEKDPSPAAVKAAADLSVSLSENNLRATSATSGGMITHYVPPTPAGQTNSTMQSPDAQELHDSGLDRTAAGEWSAFRPRSALVTPFSLRSAHSSTPGTLEVNEAKAISIYPHTNRSILVIQEMAGDEGSPHREQKATIAGNASIAIPGAVTPIIHHEAPQREICNSPLQNPRDPPQPPDFQIIPPTPANAMSSSEDTRVTSRTISKPHRLSAPFSSVKRAFSARRHSESIVSPFTRTLSLRSSRGRRSVSAVDDLDSKLHPFWRPRSLWHDAEESDSESEFGNHGILSPQRSNSLAPPSRTMSLTSRLAGPLRTASTRVPRRASSLSTAQRPTRGLLPYEVERSGFEQKKSTPITRRLTGSLKLPSSHRPRRSTTAAWANQPHYKFVHPSENDYTERRQGDMPREGFQVQFVGYRGLVDRLQRRREMRKEGKREARRDWLRGRIGYVGPEVGDGGHERS